MILQPHQIIRLSTRLFIAGVSLSVVGFFYGKQIISLFFPFIDFVISISVSEYNPHLSIVEQQGSDLIQMNALSVEPIQISPGHTIPVGAVMTAGTYVMHSLVPLVILFSIILAIPLKTWIERLVSLVIASLFMVLVLGLSTPYILMGYIEILYQNISSQIGVDRPTPFMLTWMFFVETGGQWLLAVVCAFSCLLLTIYIRTRNDRPTARL